MIGSHDTFLVTLSILIAVFASFTALRLGARIRASAGWKRRIWLAIAAITLGGGIWSMHFVAMLAFSMPGMVMSYDLGLTLLSLGIALAFTGGGFALMRWKHASPGRILAAGFLMGSGVLAMHYVGMAAMRMDATLIYERFWLSVSVLVAIGAAIGAVWLASLEHKISLQLAAAGFMGTAIAGMHYAGMKAAVFTASPNVNLADGLASITQTYLAVAISAITVLILLLALGAARLERTFQAFERREAQTAMRLKIADVLRGRDTRRALNEVASLLGEHFDVSRVGYAEFDPNEDVFDSDVCWTNGTVRPLLGRYSAAAYGVKGVSELSAGRTVVIDDLLETASSDEVGTSPNVREIDARAILVVPFVRGGELRGIVYLNDQQTRKWQPAEVRFMEEMAERTRLVIERAAVEDQLREFNATLEARIDERTAELREAEAARRQADALYRAYFENTPDPLFLIAVEEGDIFVVEQINPAHETGVGFKLEEVQGKRIDEILAPDTSERLIATYRHVRDSGELYQYRDVFKLAGETQHWDTTLVPLQGADGKVVRLIGSSRNVTRQVNAEEALRQSQKMEAMGQLTGGVAHDFNNLLTPIIGSLDRLQRKGLGDERDQRLITGAAQAAERARVLVQRLLSFARRQPLQLVAVDVSKLVGEMKDLISSTTGPQIKVLVEAPEQLPAATVDANQLEMALLNLSVNARDAMPDGGTLRISVSAQAVQRDHAAELKPGGYIRLSVADTGSGMDQETLRRAVEPFFSTKGIGRGTGLGLSMVHGLAAQLGGAMTIRSELGVGTTVELWLPQSATSATPEDAASTSHVVPLTRGTALLVEDEELVRISTAEMLGELGYHVEVASCAEDALQLIDAGLAFELMVTDHLMPGMHGTELARIVLLRRPGTQVLIISGYTDVDGIASDLPRLIKPFRHSDLLAKLTEAAEAVDSEKHRSAQKVT
jgi:PAS domain S-box-containing protein